MWFLVSTLGRPEKRVRRYSVMSNVWNEAHGPGICLLCLLVMFLHGHGNVADSSYGPIFPPGKQRLKFFFSFLLGLHYGLHGTS